MPRDPLVTTDTAGFWQLRSEHETTQGALPSTPSNTPPGSNGRLQCYGPFMRRRLPLVTLTVVAAAGCRSTDEAPPRSHDDGQAAIAELSQHPEVVDVRLLPAQFVRSPRFVASHFAVAAPADGVVETPQPLPDFETARAWVAEQLQIAPHLLGERADPPFEPFDDDYEEAFRFGEPAAWAHWVLPSYRGVPLVQRPGVFLANGNRLYFDVCVFDLAPASPPQELAAGLARATRWLRDEGARPGEPGEPELPVLVYARPESAAQRQELGWPDEAQGLVFRPSWLLTWDVDRFLDGRTGVVWSESAAAR